MKYLEDMEIGRTSAFGRYQVTREEVVEFASRYDPQPFHLDDAAAAATYFGRLSASGWHTAAMTMRMMADNMRANGHAGLGSPGIDELRWLKPVYPGDTLRVELTVTDVRPSRSRPEMGSIKTETRVFNQHDQPVMTMKSNVLMERRPAAGTQADPALPD